MGANKEIIKEKKSTNKLSAGWKAFLLTFAGCLILAVGLCVALAVVSGTSYLVNNLDKAMQGSSADWSGDTLYVKVPIDKGSGFDWEITPNSNQVKIVDVEYYTPESSQTNNIFGYNKYTFDLGGTPNPTITFEYKEMSSGKVIGAFNFHVTADNGVITNCWYEKTK